MKYRFLKILLFIVIALAAITSRAQISPGDLARVHAHLEGISNCTKCHTLGDKVTDEKCLDCHKEIKIRIDQKKGYHYSRDVRAKACYECHNDHHGRNFQIIRFDTQQFDHKLAGYLLEGAHKRAECNSCHKKENIEDKNLRKKDKTYLGLNTSCISCHEDYHQQTLSQNCLDCHDYEVFKPAENFDHSKTSYLLKGKHRNVECIKCHEITTLNGKQFQKFSGISYSNCNSCHDDVHNNQFGQDCSSCHTEVSFHQVKNLGNFNHNNTGFPLEGKHINLSCESCHKSSYTDPVAHRYCTDCHDDYHQGDFLENEIVRDCSDCHDVNGFSGSSFNIEQHQESVFPLKGAHLATPCFVCHKKTERWEFRNIGNSCIDCHENIHQDYMSEKYFKTNCYTCHDESRWNFVVFDHNSTGYPLLGKHEEQSCRACHFKMDDNGQERQIFIDLNSSCLNCHDDMHYGQFEVSGIVDCERCHDYNNWKASLFDHNKTNFPLEGKHKEIECSRCHKEVSEDNNTYVLYKIEDYRCEACH